MNNLEKLFTRNDRNYMPTYYCENCSVTSLDNQFIMRNAMCTVFEIIHCDICLYLQII